jgi:hypothetical protein
MSSCKKPEDNPVNNFFIKNYVPDAVISKNDTMYFDVNQDGKDDFIAFQHKYSSSEVPYFGSVDTACVLSRGIENPPYSVPSWTLIVKNDSINNNLNWQNLLAWTKIDTDSVYLGIRLNDNEMNYYYGWLLPIVKRSSNNSLTVYIDKFVFCKLKNHVILAGQEKD